MLEDGDLLVAEAGAADPGSSRQRPQAVRVPEEEDVAVDRAAARRITSVDALARPASAVSPPGAGCDQIVQSGSVSRIWPCDALVAS